MIKTILNFLFLIAFVSYNHAQIVFLQEDFQNPIPNMLNALPPGITNDTNWYNFDLDSLPDGSGEARPSNWYPEYAFSIYDSLTWVGDTNIVMASSSMFTSPGKANNWLISPYISIVPSNTVFSWKSAPISTPFKLDGYKVLISYNTNALSDFTDTVFIASEYDGPGNIGIDFSSYSFTPSNGWIHGWDGVSVLNYTVVPNADTSMYCGLLTTFGKGCVWFVPGFYFAIVHDSYDDNLISIDDIRVEFCESINENQINALSIYPNPATDYFEIKNLMGKKTTCQLISTSGQIFYPKINLLNNRIDVSDMQNGIYVIRLMEEEKIIATQKLIIIH